MLLVFLFGVGSSLRSFLIGRLVIFSVKKKKKMYSKNYEKHSSRVAIIPYSEKN